MLKLISMIELLGRRVEVDLVTWVGVVSTKWDLELDIGVTEGMETLLKLGALVEVALGPVIGLRLLHSFSKVLKVFGFELDIKCFAQI